MTDADPALATAIAAELGKELWDMREIARPTYISIAEAVDRIRSADAGPIVFADTSDNAGGGAASDSTFFLDAILALGVRDIAMGLFWDPVAVRLCLEAGEGSVLGLRVGGKCSAASGQPIDRA